MDYKKYRTQLLDISDKMGLLSSMTEEKRANILANREDFVIAEAWARYIIDTVFYEIDPRVRVHQLPQYSTFDAEIESGRTIQVEAKCRNFSSGRYKTSKLSYKKGDFIDKANGWLLVFWNGDGHYRIFDLEKYKPKLGWWNHTHYTAEAKDLDNYKERERCWIFDNDAAIMEGNLVKNGARKKGDS